MINLIKRFKLKRIYNGSDTGYFEAKKTELDFHNEETEKLRNELKETISTIEKKTNELNSYKSTRNDIENSIATVIDLHTKGDLTEEQFNKKIQELKSNKATLQSNYDILLQSQVIESLQAKQTALQSKLNDAELEAKSETALSKLNEIKELIPKLTDTAKALETDLYSIVQLLVDLKQIDKSYMPNTNIIFDNVEYAVDNLNDFMNNVSRLIAAKGK